MRSLFLTAALALTACTAGAQGNADAGARTSRSFQVGTFDRINLAGSPDVVVAVGGQPSVRAEGEAADLERLEIAVVEGELRISMRPGSSSWGSHRGITVHVAVPSLQAAAIRGSGDINIDQVQGPTFAATVDGSGDLDVRQLRVAGDASFNITGSGGIRAGGGAQRTNASLNGSGDLSLAGFETRDATISLVGSGDVALRATGTAAVQLTGSGGVTIAGGARCTIAKSGSGDVNCGTTEG